MVINIITVVRNNAEGMKKTAESLETQICQDFNWIIWDGLSSDNTLQMVPKRSNFKVYSQKDNGIYDALNRAIKIAPDGYIFLLHSGDVLPNVNVVSELRSFVLSTPDVVIAPIDMILRYKWVKRRFPVKLLPSKRRNFLNLPAHTGVIFKKTIFLEIGEFNKNYKISADFDWLIRLFARDDVRMLHFPDVIVKMAPAGLSGRLQSTLLEDYKVINTYSRYPAIGVLLKKMLKLLTFRLNLD